MNGNAKRNHPAFLSFAAFAIGVVAPVLVLSRSRHELLALMDRFGDVGLVAIVIWPAVWHLLGFAFGLWGTARSFRGFGGRLVAFASTAINLVFLLYGIAALSALRAEL